MDIPNKIINTISEQGRELRQNADGKVSGKNKFPTEDFPQVLKDIINETQRVLNYSPEFMACAMMASAGAAIGNTYIIDINGQFIGKACLFVIGIAPSGVGKSSPFDFANEPHRKRDDRHHKRYDEQWNEFERISKLSEAERKAEGLEGIPPEPVRIQSLFNDCTPEAMIDGHIKNPRGVYLFYDEFAEYLQNMNRYNNSTSDAKMLKMLDGRGVAVNRKVGRDKSLPMPCISLAGTMQTGKLKTLAEGGKGVSGFVFRILFAFPDTIIKQKKSEDPVYLDYGVKKAWQAVIDRLYDIDLQCDENNVPEPKVLRLSKEANRLHTAWYNKNVDVINADIDDNIKSVCAKLEIAVYRIALIMQLLNYVTGEGGLDCIEEKAMRCAISQMDYFKATAIKVQNIINDTNPLEQLPEDKRGLYNALPTTFERKDALPIAVNYYGKNKKTEAAIQQTLTRLFKIKELFTKSGTRYTKVLLDDDIQVAA